jgi:hypothetical protein
MQRGADLFDVFMSIRFARSGAARAGAWTLLCRMAAAFRDEDRRHRAGRQSWDDIGRAKARNAHLASKVVGMNIAGRRGGGK